MVYIKLSLLSLFCFMLPHVCFSTTNSIADENQNMLNNLSESSAKTVKIVNSKKTINEAEQIQKSNSYFSIHGGKTLSHNSQDIVSSIKTLSKTAIESKYEKFKFFLEDILNSINKCKAEADFRWLGSAALGYYIGNNGRFEFEAAYFQGAMSSNAQHLVESTKKLNPPLSKGVSALNCSGEISMYTLMPNLYYNFNIKNTSLSPYVGFGVGIIGAKLAFDKSDDHPEQTPLKLPWVAYQAKLGFNYPLTPKAKISLGYRYFNIPLPIVDSIANHSIEAGLIFDF